MKPGQQPNQQQGFQQQQPNQQQALPKQMQQQPNLQQNQQPVYTNQAIQQQGQQQFVQQQQFQPQQQVVNPQYQQQQQINQQAFAGQGNLQQSAAAGQQPPVNNAPQQPQVNAPQQPIVAQSNNQPQAIQRDQVVGAAAPNVQAAGGGAPPPPKNNPKQSNNVAPVDNHLIQAAVKHGLDAYDREQHDVHKPVEIPKEEQIVPGRDLKGDRSKRSALQEYDPKFGGGDVIKVEELELNCLNDPFCDEKFSRNPVSDSLVDRDLTKFMKVGKRSLLKVEPETNNTEGEARSL